ncbi:MAG: N-6 DNA methylase [Bacteroidota bacterium]
MASLDLFNKTLNELRNSFHKYGKLSDANSKLDEISKLIAIELYELKVSKGHSSIPVILSEYRKSKSNIVSQLQSTFQKAATDEMFYTTNGTPIFGQNPKLEIDDEDNDFAAVIVELVHKSIRQIKEQNESFDLINESFGHFVRDNFRNNIEDAQYLTPQEVVDLMVAISLKRIDEELLDFKKDFTVCDPCCGVGSFMTSFYRSFLEKLNNRDAKVVKIVAQDKVQRMVRLTRLNFNLFDTANFDVSSGNSLIGDSNLDKYQDKVDLILTNPPFGAFFSRDELSNEGDLKYPLLSDLFGNNAKISSEVLFIDRCLSLLREGGELLAVVPDSVISSKGISETLRYRILMNEQVELMSIIELPTVAFAQAGTKTKTSILHLKKTTSDTPQIVFIAKSQELGFDVSIRKGATIKVQKGMNDLPEILKSYRKYLGKKPNKDEVIVFGESPSAVAVPCQNFHENPWTPCHYDSSMFKELNKLDKSSDIELMRLDELAKFITKERKKEKRLDDSKCISILHVVNGDIIDYRSLLSYEPKYPGVVCKAGDLLFSKINPRIPRALVIPNNDLNLTCSSEFEIIQSTCDLTNAELRALLMLPSVQLQINQLTSGTSSSHSRIKTQELAKVLIPIPNKKSVKGKSFKNLLEKEATDHDLINQLAIDRYFTHEKLQLLIA